jgi:4-amino-4-deoxy-L-arabinose transferase-like glycosyltransferase
LARIALCKKSEAAPLPHRVDDHTTPLTSRVSDAPIERLLPAQAPARPAAPRTPRLSWLVLGCIAAVYIAACCAPVIFDDNEGLYAGAVREMHASGNWLLPTVNGFPRVQKPPLVYWTMLVSTSVLGQNEFALRLPNALATLGWIFATYLIARRLGGERLGLASALILATMLGVWIFNHLVQPEPYLACFVALSIWCLIEARLSAQPEQSRPSLIADRFPGDRWYLLFWLFLGLGAMSKGLHGALWPLGTALLAALFVPRLRPWLKPVLSLRGFALFVLILAPWYIYKAVKLPGFLAAHFVNEQLGAAMDSRYPADARQLPLLQFYGQHFLFWMPWTLLLPAAIYLAVKARRFTRTGHQVLSPVQVDLIGLLACWFALTQVSVAFSTRQDYYSMSCWGVVAIFLAVPWIAEAQSGLRLPRRFLVVPSALVLLGGTMALALAAYVAPRLGSLGAGGAAPIRDRDTFMDAIEGISPGLWGHFLTLLAIFGAVMFVAGIAATALAWRRRAFPALLVLSAAMAAPIGLATAGFAMMGPYFSLADEARAINAGLAAQPGAIVACEALPHTASSLYYYLNARVHWVNAPFDQQYAQRVLNLGRDFFWDENGLLAQWHSSQRVYFIIEEDRLDYWQKTLPHARTLIKSGTRLVLCNQ